MLKEEAAAVHINQCLQDDELETMQACADSASPGEWRVHEGTVVRYSGDPVNDPKSLIFITKARGYVPRLLKGVRVLETALRTAWAEAKSWKMSCVRERQQYEDALARHANQKTGPIEDLEFYIEIAELHADTRSRIAREIQAWAVGKKRHPGVYSVDIERARRDAAEREERRLAVATEYEQKVRQLNALLDELQLTKQERRALQERAQARFAGDPKT
jgi:hypothetical protein